MRLKIIHSKGTYGYYKVYDEESKLWLSEQDEDKASYGGVWQPDRSEAIELEAKFEAQADIDHMEGLLRHIKGEGYDET